MLVMNHDSEGDFSRGDEELNPFVGAHNHAASNLSVF